MSNAAGIVFIKWIFKLVCKKKKNLMKNERSQVSTVPIIPRLHHRSEEKKAGPAQTAALEVVTSCFQIKIDPELNIS